MSSYRRPLLTASATLFALLWSCPLWAEALIDLKTGTQIQVNELLQQGQVLVFVEKDCAICKRYVADLQGCRSALKSAIVVVSVSTAAQTKEMKRFLPREFPLYLVKGEVKALAATPTTRTARGQKVGIMSCAQVERL